jgi:hypothetical protein
VAHNTRLASISLRINLIPSSKSQALDRSGSSNNHPPISEDSRILAILYGVRQRQVRVRDTDKWEGVLRGVRSVRIDAGNGHEISRCRVAETRGRVNPTYLSGELTSWLFPAALAVSLALAAPTAASSAQSPTLPATAATTGRVATAATALITAATALISALVPAASVLAATAMAATAGLTITAAVACAATLITGATLATSALAATRATFPATARRHGTVHRSSSRAQAARIQLSIGVQPGGNREYNQNDQKRVLGETLTGLLSP